MNFFKKHEYESVTFSTDNDIQFGRLFFVDGELIFEGDTKESAQQIFEHQFNSIHWEDYSTGMYEFFKCTDSVTGNAVILLYDGIESRFLIMGDHRNDECTEFLTQLSMRIMESKSK